MAIVILPKLRSKCSPGGHASACEEAPASSRGSRNFARDLYETVSRTTAATHAFRSGESTRCFTAGGIFSRMVRRAVRKNPVASFEVNRGEFSVPGARRRIYFSSWPEERRGSIDEPGIEPFVTRLRTRHKYNRTRGEPGRYFWKRSRRMGFRENPRRRISDPLTAGKKKRNGGNPGWKRRQLPREPAS